MPELLTLGLIVAVLAYGTLLRKSVFILTYHSISEGEFDIPGLEVSSRAFANQLRLLAALGFRAENLDQVVDDIRRGTRGNFPVLCITFDDGYRGVLANAAPLLLSRNWPATLFVPTSLAGRSNEWDAGSGIRSVPLLGWEELRKLTSMGFAIGSHSRMHRSMLHIPEDECRQELQGSLADLDRNLSRVSRVFCYPYGHRKPGLRRLVEKSGYQGACSLIHNAYPDDLYDLGRLNVRTNNIVIFAWNLAAYPLISLARKLVR